MKLNSKQKQLAKEILVEDWNEGHSSNEELLSYFESNLPSKLDESHRQGFLKMLADWNSFGIGEYITFEKRDLSSSPCTKHAEKYLEKFVSNYI